MSGSILPAVAGLFRSDGFVPAGEILPLPDLASLAALVQAGSVAAFPPPAAWVPDVPPAGQPAALPEVPAAGDLPAPWTLTVPWIVPLPDGWEALPRVPLPLMPADPVPEPVAEPDLADIPAEALPEPEPELLALPAEPDLPDRADAYAAGLPMPTDWI